MQRARPRVSGWTTTTGPGWARSPATDPAQGRSRRRTRRSLRGLEHRLPEGEEVRPADAELAHLLHGRLHLRRRLLAFALAGLGLRGEVEDLRPLAVVVTDRHAAGHVRTERGAGVRRHLRHELLDAVGIGDPALHDLDEAGLIGVALEFDGHI